MEDYDRHNCADGSHTHISFSQYTEHRQKNIVAILRAPGGRRVKGVAKIQLLPQRDDRWAGKPSRSRAAGEQSGMGLSARVGPYLAMRVRQSKASNGANHAWALVMLAQINNRPDREDVALVPVATLAVNQSAY